ncbi:MAG: hypothetical protein ABEH38_08940 [Flavobacteriales bacterium]
MKRSLTLFLSLLIALFFTACGAGGPKVSKEMKGFMKKLEKSNSISDAAAAYGYEAKDIPLDLYELKNPNVVKSKKKDGSTCYTMKVDHGMVHSKVNVCWKKKKVVGISEK